MKNSNVVLIDRHPGRSTQTIGIARELGTDPELIHEPSVGVVGTKGDSQCYLGVMAKVDAIHARAQEPASARGRASSSCASCSPSTRSRRPTASATARARCAIR